MSTANFEPTIPPPPLAVLVPPGLQRQRDATSTAVLAYFDAARKTASGNAEDEQRVTADFKNVIFDAHAIADQNFGPDFRQLHLDGIARGHIGTIGKGRLRFGRRECLAMS